jgi:hypothetical protein
MSLTARILQYAARGYGLRESVVQAQRDADEDERTIAQTKRLLACYRYTPTVQNRQKHAKEEQ